MFKMVQPEAYFWPVKVEMPVTGGRFETQTFDAKFKFVSQSRFKEIFEEIRAEKVTEVSLLKELVVGWKGIDDNGVEVPFSEDALERLLDVPAVAAAMLQAFAESRSGSKRKN